MFAILPTLLSAILPVALTATVNDGTSHGTLGDNRLSLDEAIRLANGTLTLAQLSASEAAQVTGSGTTVDRIVIDPMVTPLINLTAPLTPVSGTGSPLTIEGMAHNMGGSQMVPRLLGNSHAHVLALRTHLVQVMGLRIDGGQVGADVQTANASMTLNLMAMLMDCEFDQQAVAAIQLRGTGAEQSGLMLHHVHFRNLPLGVLIDDQTNFGWTMLEGEHCHFDNVVRGADVIENGRGNQSMCMFFRSDAVGGANFIRVRRGTGSSQQFMVRLVFCDLATSGDVVDVQGIGGGLTMIHTHHSNFSTGPGGKALFVWPRTGDFDVHGSEMQFTGDVSLAASLFTQRVWQQNNVYRHGTLTFDIDGAAPNFLWNRYENCSVIVPTSARTAVQIRSSEFVNTVLDGRSLFAALSTSGSYRLGGGLLGSTTESTPAPAPFLASTRVVPTEAQLGSQFQLVADLPPGIAAIWDVAEAYERPNTAVEPFRYYGDPTTVVVVGAFVTAQSVLTYSVPNNPLLLDCEVYFQAIAVPTQGQTYVPPYHLPRGGRLKPIL